MITKIYKIKLRETFEGHGLKPNVDRLDGKKLRLGILWTQDDADPYPGELALGPVDIAGRVLFDTAGILWLSSGDTENGSVQ